MICCVFEAVYLSAQAVRNDETCMISLPGRFAMLTTL